MFISWEEDTTGRVFNYWLKGLMSAHKHACIEAIAFAFNQAILQLLET